MNTPTVIQADPESDLMILNEVQLLLSEKRTALSSLRTGIAIFAFPLSVLSVLVATSQAYEPLRVLYWLVPLVVINLGLVGLAIYLIVHSFRRIHRYDRMIQEFKRQHTRLAPLLD